MRVILNPVIFRQNISTQITIKLTQSNITKPSIAINLEKGVYNYSIEHATIHKIVKKWDNPYFVIIYLNKLKSILLNLLDNKILQNLKDDPLIASKIPFMTHYELQPDRWRDLIISKEKKDKHILESKIEASSEDFICGKCKQNKTTYCQAQTRSADESMTTFVTCLTCGNKWKM